VISGRGEARIVVERYLAALNRHDADAVAECVAEDFFNEHTSAAGTSVRGRAAYRARLPAFLERFRDLHYQVEDMIVEDNRTAVAYTMTCAVNDHPVQIRGMFRFRVDGGLIAHRVDYWDGTEFERQVGADASETTAKRPKGSGAWSRPIDEARQS
jgi:steroid delta-isomerase-like uncharacterized protein